MQRYIWLKFVYKYVLLKTYQLFSCSKYLIKNWLYLQIKNY